MKRSLVIAARTNVLVSLAGRRRRISLEWMIYILMVRPSFSCIPLTFLRAFDAALGIADEVDRLGLKGSKKKRSKKLDEDWMVIAPEDSFFDEQELTRASI
jgi:hypothetical protein